MTGHNADDGAAARRLAHAIERLRTLTQHRPRTGSTHADGDGDVGTVATDDAVGFDPRPLLAAFDRAGVRVVVFGQVAGILLGSSELTGDLDLLWSGESYDHPRLAAAFAGQHAVLTDDDGAPVGCDAAAFSLPKVQFRTATAAGDCCTPALAWGALDVAAFLGRAVTVTVDGFAVHHLAAADLIAMRRAVGRPKDLRRAAELEALLAPGTSER